MISSKLSFMNLEYFSSYLDNSAYQICIYGVLWRILETSNIGVFCFRIPPYGHDEWSEWGYYPKNFAIVFVLIVSLYTCIPIPPVACISVGALVSVLHLIALLVEFINIPDLANTDQIIVEGTVYAGYTLKLVRLSKTKLLDKITWIFWMAQRVFI